MAGFISLLDLPHPVVTKDPVKAFDNIAYDGTELRDPVIGIKPLFH